MSDQPQVPKQPGIPEAIATAIMPASIAAKLDASNHWSDHWRSALRFVSTYADLTTLSSLAVAGTATFQAEKALGISLGWGLKASIALGIVGVFVSLVMKFRTQRLPPPPPPAHDPTNDAGA